jgi:hypothetical protein
MTNCLIWSSSNGFAAAGLLPLPRAVWLFDAAFAGLPGLSRSVLQ